MDDEREILTQSISDQELERRWKEVRKRMERNKIDFFIPTPFDLNQILSKVAETMESKSFSPFV